MAISGRQRLLIIFVFMIAAFSAAHYIREARSRANAHECFEVTSPSGLYRAQSCATGVDGNVVFYVGRLYDARRGVLLARTDFDSVDSRLPEFLPDERSVIFRRGEGDGSGTGFINIPPNWLERLKAKIP